MKKYFRKTYCSACGKPVDPTASLCPSCGHNRLSDSDGPRGFEQHIHCGWPRQLISFLIGWAGFQVAGFIFEIILLAVYLAVNSGASIKDAKAWAVQGWPYLLINFGGYTLTFLALLLTLWPARKQLVKPLTQGRSYLAGLIGGIAIIGSSIAWSYLAQTLWPDTTANANQSALEGMIKSAPILSLLFLGLIAPACEELTYRVGLFGFLKRWNIYAAYIIAPIVFGLIHFDWTAIGKSTITNELIDIPSYIIAGVGFAFIYDHYGLGASWLAHCTNNLTSVILAIVKGYLTK